MNAKQIAMALAIVIGIIAAERASAQTVDYGYGPTAGLYSQPQTPGLFNARYTQPGASQVNAQMYQAPVPVPYHVGHTVNTYEPLYPHEHLYAHRRTYYNYYAGPEMFYGDGCKQRATGGGALNKTTVVWQSGCSHYGNFPGAWFGLQNWGYKRLAKKYCLGASCAGKRAGGHGSHAAGGCAGGNCGQ